MSLSQRRPTDQASASSANSKTVKDIHQRINNLVYQHVQDFNDMKSLQAKSLDWQRLKSWCLTYLMVPNSSPHLHVTVSIPVTYYYVTAELKDTPSLTYLQVNSDGITVWTGQVVRKIVDKRKEIVDWPLSQPQYQYVGPIPSSVVLDNTKLPPSADALKQESSHDLHLYLVLRFTRAGTGYDFAWCEPANPRRVEPGAQFVIRHSTR